MWGDPISVLVDLGFLSLGEGVVVLAGVERFSDVGLVVNFALGGKVSFAISTMSKVAGATYLQDIPISLQPVSTPFLATDQKGSLA